MEASFAEANHYWMPEMEGQNKNLARLLLCCRTNPNMNYMRHKIEEFPAVKRLSVERPSRSSRMTDSVFGSEIRASFSL